MSVMGALFIDMPLLWGRSMHCYINLHVDKDTSG